MIPSAVGGLLAAVRSNRKRSPEQLAGLGGAIGFVQGMTNLIMNLAIDRTPLAIWTVVMPEAVFWELSGIAWCWVALGLSPYLERMFDIVTPNEIINWSTPIPPAIERLIFEAPDTFQQTIFITALAEAAAKVTGSNVNLVRAGAIYHNIGKLEDLSGVLAKGINDSKHNLADNPWQKAEQLKQQIERGLIVAAENQLPSLIKAFIPEHRGTILMSDLYQQAKQAGHFRTRTLHDRPVKESDFRYDGPIPQSAETGLVLLAHACGTALQSLNNETFTEALAIVSKIIDSLWDDGQLLSSGLDRKQIESIAQTFVREWEKTIASTKEN